MSVRERLRQEWPYLLALLTGIAAAVAQRAANADSPSGVLDLYPLYYGAQALREVGNAYDLTAVAPAAHADFAILRTGNAYPLLATLLALPLAPLSPLAASFAFLSVTVLALVAACRYAGAPLWVLLWTPLLSGLQLEQATVLVLAAQIAAVGAWQRGHRRTLAVLLALCLIKPNQTVLLILLLAWQTRSWWRIHLTALAALWLPTLLAQPDWIARWLPVALDRNNTLLVEPQWMPWLVLPALILWLRHDRLAATAVAVLALQPYPTPALYPLAPLILGLRGRQALWSALAGLACFCLHLQLSTRHDVAVAVAVFVSARVALSWLAPDRANTPAAEPTTKAVDTR